MRRFLSVAVLAAAFAGTTAGLAQAQDDPSNFTLPAPACESGSCADSNGQDGYGQDGTAHSVATDESGNQ
ncbi:hypothetical protein AB0L88_06250 [Saccharopolyspora shandongensis]|uniref:hypothetical protein n=1 Tax=Saccharopolyspora shandongensis TaxID=418495 RepID=UPI00341A78B2